MIDLPPGTRLVLASGSPRRSDLLRSVGLDFEVRPADIDESLRPGEAPEAYVLRLSSEKAWTASEPEVVVLAADTTVEVGGRVLGKPADDDEARMMLGLLSGVVHRVHTGVTVIAGDRDMQVLVTSSVGFVDLDDATVEWYVATGEPMDKAGGYAIQGAGGALVAGVEGSVSNVIGLPLAETLAMVRLALAES